MSTASTLRDISPPPRKRKRLSSSGSAQEQPKQHNDDEKATLTVYSWNINGIAPFIQRPITSFFKTSKPSETNTPNRNVQETKHETHPPSLRDFLHRHSWPALLFLQEVKINPDDASTISAVEKSIQRQPHEPPDSPSYTAHFCLPTDSHNARGFGRKVYGVCSLIRSDFYLQHVVRVRPVDWDREGRFLVVETKGSGLVPKLALINVYAVNGTENPYKDPETGEVRGTRHERKLRVHALLQEECRRLEAEGFGIVVAGDVNVARTARDGYPNLRTWPKQHCLNREDFEGRFFASHVEGEVSSSEPGTGEHRLSPDRPSGLGMIDTFRHLHPEKHGYTYYPRTKTFGESCDRVDMILVSKELKRNLKEAGMHETPADRGPSDHVPLFARLDFQKAQDADDEEKCHTKAKVEGLSYDH